MKLIVGLWNPGQKYEKTKHNIGFVVLDTFVNQNNLWEFSYDNKVKGEILKTDIEWEKVTFLKPMEFMNLSWGAIAQIANFYKIPAENVLVIHDDIDLPTAKIQLKLWGSAAWHNGLKDIIAKLSTKEFYRLRIGVDRPTLQQDVSDYVLSSFKTTDREKIEDQQPSIEENIREFLK